MRLKNTVIRNRSLGRSLRLIVLLTALALVGANQGPGRAEASGTTQTVVVTPPPVSVLVGTLVAVNNGPGNQTSPRVNCDRVSYTNDDLEGSSTIRLFDFSTGADIVVPGNGLDRLSDVSDTKVVFTEITSAMGDQIVVFDTTTQTRTVVSGFNCNNASLGGNLVAFEDRTYTYTSPGDIDVFDLGTGTITRLSNDALFDKNPAVSPTGNAIVWEKCQTDGTGCDIYAAIQTSAGVFSTVALTGAASEDHHPDTNGEIVVYTSNRGGETDIYYQPLAGGAETQIAIPGDQRDVRISGNLIVFESQTAGGYDIFVYDISSGILYQATNTPSVDETLSDISVCNGIGRIVYAVPGFGAFDVYAFTFQVPNSVRSQINDLIALVRSFSLPGGLENSLVTKLQDALTALGASDTATACDSLRSFINEASAKTGKALTEQQASQLINAATRISTGLGCQ